MSRAVIIPQQQQQQQPNILKKPQQSQTSYKNIQVQPSTGYISTLIPTKREEKEGHIHNAKIPIVKVKDFNIENLYYGELQARKKDTMNFSVQLLYNGFPLRLKTPRMKCIWGINEYKHPDTPEKTNYSFNISFHSEDEEVQKFLEIINAIDGNVQSTFNEQIDEAGNNFFIAQARRSKGNPNMAPFLRLKIVGKSKRLSVCIIKKNEQGTGKEEISYPSIDELKQYLYNGAENSYCIELGNFWRIVNRKPIIESDGTFNNQFELEGKFGVSWNIVCIDTTVSNNLMGVKEKPRRTFIDYSRKGLMDMMDE